MLRKPFCGLLQFTQFRRQISASATRTVIVSLNTCTLSFNSHKERNLFNLSNSVTITQKKSFNKQYIHSNKMFSSKHSLLEQPAPSIKLQKQDGDWIELNSFIGNGKPSVVFFYPKDESYGCTKEVCSFRDSYSEFSDAGATVVGISSDPVDNHKKFSDSQKLQFPLLSDPNGEARKLYEVPKTLGFLPGRATYLIDKDGIIRDIFNSQMDFEGHVKKSVEFVKSQLAKVDKVDKVDL